MLRQRPGRPLPRSAGEALCDGVRLTLVHLRPILLLSILGWAPGELVRLLVRLLPLSPWERVLGTAVSMGLTLAGMGFVCAAVLGLLGRQAPAGAAWVAWADRTAALSGRRLLTLLAFGLLVAGWMAPLVAASLASRVLLPATGHCLLAHGVGLVLSFLGTLQSLGAAVGLALLYADACADSGLPTRLGHLARWQ